MIGMMLLQAVVFCSDPRRGAPGGLPLCMDAGRPAEVGVCGVDPNRPDLTVCVEGREHRIRLVMPYPPCGTPEAKAAPQCAKWEIGSPPSSCSWTEQRGRWSCVYGSSSKPGSQPSLDHPETTLERRK